MAIDKADNVYVVEAGRYLGDPVFYCNVRKITPDGLVTTIATGFSRSNEGQGPGVAVSPTGAVYVCSYDGVFLITPGGKLSQVPAQMTSSTAGSQFPSSAWSVTRISERGGTSIAIDMKGELYIGGYGPTSAEVAKMSNGVFKTLAAGFKTVNGIAVDAGGNVFVSDYWRIAKITPAGAVTTFAGNNARAGSEDGPRAVATFGLDPGSGEAQPTYRFIVGLALDAEGTLFVADTANGRIRRITPTGIVQTIATEVSSEALVLNSQGSLLVPGFSRILRGTKSFFEFDTGQAELGFSGGAFQGRITGPAGTMLIVETSRDLSKWSPLATNSVASDGLSFSSPTAADGKKFFRTHSAP